MLQQFEKMTVEKPLGGGALAAMVSINTSAYVMVLQMHTEEPTQQVW